MAEVAARKRTGAAGAAPRHSAAATAASAASAFSAASAEKAVALHRDNDSEELFGIAELCQQFSITPRSLRFYEDKGLLSPRRVNGARIYTRRDRARLAIILRSKAIGASLDEIKHYLDLYGAHGEGRTQQLKFVLQRTDSAIAQLQERRAHIDAMLAEMRIINQQVREHLSNRGPT